MKKTIVWMGLAVATLATIGGCAKTEEPAPENAQGTTATSTTAAADPSKAATTTTAANAADPKSIGENKDVVGKVVPPFSMTDVSGKVHTDQTLRGKVVLLDFWASWCGPCKIASPAMQALHTRFADRGLVVIGANGFEQDGKSKEAAEKYAKEHNYTYTFTVDNDKLLEEWRIAGVPFFMLIDREGVIRHIVPGLTGDAKEMERVFAGKIESLLAKTDARG